MQAMARQTSRMAARRGGIRPRTAALAFRAHACGPTNIVMSFDRMGRRVSYLETVSGGSFAPVTNGNYNFVYDDYLCIQRIHGATKNVKLIFTWDPLETIATKPLMVEKPGSYKMHVTHDGNKNVSELVFFSGGSGIAAHYEYAPFGAVTASTRNTSVTAYDFRTYNPFRFSSEYADDTLGLVYYNYRHYNPVDGRWTSRDPLDEFQCNNLYVFVFNVGGHLENDGLGLKGKITICSERSTKKVEKYYGAHSWIEYVPDKTFMFEYDYVDARCKKRKGKIKIVANRTYYIHSYSARSVGSAPEGRAGVNFKDSFPKRQQKASLIESCETMVDHDAEQEMLKFVFSERAKGASAWNEMRNCSMFATECWEVATGDSIDPSNGRTVGESKCLETCKDDSSKVNKLRTIYRLYRARVEGFAAHSGVKRGTKESESEYLKRLLPLPFLCPENLADAIKAHKKRTYHNLK